MLASIRNAAAFYLTASIWFITLFAAFFALHDVTGGLLAGSGLDAAVQPMVTLSIAMFGATTLAGASWALIRRLTTGPETTPEAAIDKRDDSRDAALAPIR